MGIEVAQSDKKRAKDFFYKNVNAKKMTAALKHYGDRYSAFSCTS
jgi:hypothetical protein